MFYGKLYKNSLMMKIAFKNFLMTLKRYKVASLLNVLGLTLAFVAFYIIASQVWFTLTYNHSLKDAGRTYLISPNSDPEKVEVKFFDNELEMVYQREDKLSTLVTLFSFLSIVISIIGVFGLVLFETQYRRREIGIRRVHGASVSEILSLFNRKYLYIVAICSAVAIPVSYYIIDQWMQQYVYRTPMSWWVYALAVAIILAITVVTVTMRSVKAATENPTESIMR